MKTGKKLERDAWFFAKVDQRKWTHRLIWWAFRRYLLNEDHYRLTQRFTGPRPQPGFGASTLLKYATHRRMYIEHRPTTWQMEQERLKDHRLDNVAHAQNQAD